jgi:TolB-like protein/tRNA A-37 threonylcarbamoyl transferase component Bud32/Tfp pilus assembly protein PilF
MPLKETARLGPYEIVAPLGAGGMGEVYRARDTRLDRIVAIKVLPAHLSSDSTVRERFEREARIISQLTHPHICTLHDVGRHEDVDYLVMELLEGETLADRLKAGALPLDVLLELAVHVADALDAAHGAHVIHRDLKPQNIFVTKRGQAKVLDFGVAKLSDAETADDDNAAQPTVLAARALTGAGTAIGTVAYMSPEQARGEPLDATSDIFSFGAVLYEMATGQPAFSGRTSAVIIDALLNKTPERISASNAEAPLELERIIGRALAKNRRERYQHASELRSDLERLKLDRLSGAVVARGSSPWARWRTSVALAAGVIGLVAIGWTLTQRMTAIPTSGPIDSIAVLPFVNASGTADADYLSDGLAETLTNSLTRVRGLRVIPRTLAARYRNATVDPREAGAALNARAIVTGRVTQRGDRLMVQAELIDAATVAQLWGDQFDRPLADVLTVQADISKAIADNLRLHLTTEDEQDLTAGAPKNAVAYQLYLKGRYETNKRTRDGYAGATRFFEQAIVQDSTYSRAHAGLADVYLWQGYWGYLRAAEAYPKAMAAAERALALDEQTAEAHASLGWLNLYYLWNWSDSQRQYQRALELDPDSAFVHAWYGESLSTRGRHADAIAEVRRAAALDPLSSQIKTSLAFVLSNARQFEEAIAVQKVAAQEGVESTLAQLDLARVYRLAGQSDLAIPLSQRMVDSRDPLGPAFLAASFARAGRRNEAVAILRKLEAEARRSDQGAFLVAAVYAALGDRDPAFRWLEEAYKERDTFLPWLKVDPEFDSLRSDPRFAELIRRIGIPD